MTHPKAARISPDSRPIAYGAAGLATLIYLGAFATSFFGQASLAAYMLIPQQLQYVAPAVVDLALILFTLATLVRKSRGESTLVANLATGFWTAVSIGANVSHVLIPAGPPTSWTAGIYAGAALSALMPLAALGASLVIENVLIAGPGVEGFIVEKAEEAIQPVVAQKRVFAPSQQLPGPNRRMPYPPPAPPPSHPKTKPSPSSRSLRPSRLVLRRHRSERVAPRPQLPPCQPLARPSSACLPKDQLSTGRGSQRPSGWI